ncbi:MAG: CRISPR-associated endonuclease Cas3'', partial [Spirochaetes bacterium]|nr:CRISPR-associated endonuclease Cas3'' [Spirochaetota bacterium]
MFSHPGKKLRDHLFNVKSLALSLFNSRKTNIDNYTNDDIVKLLEIICLTHDFGKATQYFQDYLDSPNDKNNNNVLKNHSFFSAIWTYIISDKIITNKKLPLLAYFIVLKHHGDFVDFNQAIFPSDNDEIEILKKQLEKFNIEYILNNFSFNIKKNDFIKILEYFNSRQFRKKLREVEFENEDYYLANYLFSLLITSDKGDAIFFGEGEKYFKLEDYKFDKGIVNSNSVDEYKKLKILNKKTSPLNDTREIIYKEAESNIKKYYKENKIFSITAPTGSGKTFTVLNVALKLRELFKNNYKIIYALPFTSIIDQNYEVFKNVFNNPDSSIL